MRLSAFIALFTLCGFTILSAHPHVFIDCSYRLSIDSDGLQEIETSWAFDEIFSATILNDFDQNSNGFIDDNETETIYSSAFIHTKNYNYFLDIKAGSQKVIIDSVYNFKVSLNESKLIYKFCFKIPESIPTISNHIVMMSYDPSYYITVDTSPKQGLEVLNTSSLIIISDIVEKEVDFETYGVLPVNAIDLFILPEK